jgi:acyl-homoserine lactone acylase PvdQ
VSRWLLFFCVLLCLGVSSLSCRRQGSTPPASQPPLTVQLSGTIEADGLSAPVLIVRDRWGVPHVYAQSRDDLFFAQGFVQAQDRLFQMDLWHRAATGRLSEVLGANFVARDVMTRRIQYRGNLAPEWAAYGADTRAIATAFVRGVNAWVALARERPPEPFVLAGWRPERWLPIDLLNRADAFRASGDAVDEVFRARLVTALGATRAAALFQDRTLATSGDLDLSVVSSLVADVVRRAGAPPFFSGLASPVTVLATSPSAAASPPIDPARMTVGDLPSLHYLVHLHAPGWNVTGATAPWLPGVAVGHNDRVAWTMKPLDVDTQDIYVEKMNPANPHQVDDEGRWVDTTIVHDAIAVKGRMDAFTFDHEFTRHGPIVATDAARHLAFVVRWSGSEPGGAAGLGAPGLDTADSIPAFRDALSHWRFPARIVEFRGADGAAGTQAAALVPRRSSTGALPVPGWTHAFDWDGWLSPADLGREKDDRDGVLARLSALARSRADGGDSMLRDLTAAGALAAQQTLVARWLAEATRERTARETLPIVFAHPLAVQEAARRRFNVGPMLPPRAGAAPFAIAFDTPIDADAWDRTRAINAPGQAESPDSPHYADQAALWSHGDTIALPFSDAAVKAAVDVTLTLIPRGSSPSPRRSP